MPAWLDITQYDVAGVARAQNRVCAFAQRLGDGPSHPAVRPERTRPRGR